jgi:glycogen debranching enzyme
VTEFVVLKEDRSFTVSEPNGAMRADSLDGHGLWIGDTRFLSEYRLRINGEEPIAKRARTDAGSVRLEAAAGGLNVDREMYLDSGLHERITVTNPGPSAAGAEIELTLGADFVDMMALRGFARELASPPDAIATPTARGVVLNEPGGGRATEVVIRPSGTRHHVELQPGGRFSLVVDAHRQNGQEAPEFDVGLARIRDTYRSWAADCAAFETDNPAVNELLRQSRDDLRMLCDRYSTGIYPTGGLPWYAVPFGRDALHTSLFTLPANPEIARGTLRFLAAHQGRREDPRSEEEPGKILHEVRTGEVVDRGIWPHVFFGNVDASALFVCLLADTVDWTGDHDLFEDLWPAAEAALDWCEHYGDRDGDGYIECYRGRGRNQSWKDSDDSLTHVDGSDASGSAALCEVQGYLYRALLTMAWKRPALRARAAELKRRFNKDFWIERERFIAQALDRTKRRVESISSNPGHCLWSGILSAASARAVAGRLVSSELFSGWGIRTLSSRAVNYNPRNGANGCVVPFDCAIAAAGLRRAGFVKEAELVARSVLEVGAAFPARRVPEFFCGTDRVAGSPPVEHPNSCNPQSWSAASPFSLLSSVLGLTPDARRGRLRIAPSPTSLWKRLEVNGLHFAGRRIDFAVEGDRVKLGAIPSDIAIEIA